MENYRRIIKKDLGAIVGSGRTLKDVYRVIFSHAGNIAYERIVNYNIEAVTYREHDRAIRAFAAKINRTCPDAAGRYVAIDLANGSCFLTAFWAVLMSGGKPYLVNSFYPAELRLKLLRFLHIRHVITKTPDYEGFQIIDMDPEDGNMIPADDSGWENEFALSSSLTGLEAKVCVYNGESVVNQILQTNAAIKANNWLLKDCRHRIKIAVILPLFHIFGIMVSYFWFAFFGRTMVFFKDNLPDTLRGSINLHQVTHIFAPPVLFHKLYKEIMNGVSQENEAKKRAFHRGIKVSFALQNRFPSLGVWTARKLFKEALLSSFGASPVFMISGGAAINAEALRLINCIGYPLFNGYGTTETAITGVNLDKKISLRTDGSIGAPFGGIHYALDWDGTLIVSGDSVCERILYMKDEPFTAADTKPAGAPAVNTNDLVSVINGRYFITGRKSDLFIGETGENISPDGIQNALNPGRAARLCVLALNGKLSVIAEFSDKLPNDIVTKETERIRDALAAIPQGHAVNGVFVTFQPLEEANAIKVSRARLIRKIERGEVRLIDASDLRAQKNGSPETADDAMMGVIKRIFQAAVNTKAEVNAFTHFFIDLGGTSMEYLAMISDLESSFSVQINLEKNRCLVTPESLYRLIKELL